MSMIFKGSAEYCLSDHLNHWLACFVTLGLVALHDDETTQYCLQLWTNEAEYDNEKLRNNEILEIPNVSAERDDIFNLDVEITKIDLHTAGKEEGTIINSHMIVEMLFTNSTCVVARRSPVCFMKHSLHPEVLVDFPDDIYFVATQDIIINFRGATAAYLTHQLQYNRCEKQSEVHGYGLDKVFYVCTDIGEVHVDETEFLLAVTPTDVSIISLFRKRITRIFPIIKIRKYTSPEQHNHTLELEIGRIQHGNRTYTFRSINAADISDAVRQQIKLISALIDINIQKQQTLRFNESQELEKDRSMSAPDPYAGHCLGQRGYMNSEPVSETAINMIYETIDLSSGSETERARSFDMSPNISNRSVSGVYQQQSPQKQYENVPVGTGSYQEHLYYSSSSSSSDCYSYAQPEPLSRNTDSFYQGQGLLYSGQQTVDTDNNAPRYIPGLYPTTEIPYESLDQEVLYEKISSELHLRHVAGSNTNVVYQDVDLRPRRKTRRFRGESTFISYVVGGLDALKQLREKLVLFEQNRDVHVEGSGVYSVLHDPSLVTSTVSATEQKPVYDTLIRGSKG